MFKDYYKILEIKQSASKEEIKSAYRKMALKWHPDKNTQRDTTKEMQDVNEAYHILYDDIKRKRYDLEYNIFVNSHSQNKQNDKKTSFNEDDNKWYYDYEVKDEDLKEDIKSAREQAKRWMDELKESIKTSSKNAAKGAWEEAKGYIYGSIIVSIIFVLIGMCSGIK